MPDPQAASHREEHREEHRKEEALIRDRLEEILGAGSERERSLVDRLVHGFPAKATGLVDGALAAAAAGDAAGAALRIHRLRGAAAHLGAAGLPRLCQQVESLVGRGHCDQVAGHGQGLRRAVRELSLTLAGLAGSLGPERRSAASSGEEMS